MKLVQLVRKVGDIAAKLRQHSNEGVSSLNKSLRFGDFLTAEKTGPLHMEPLAQSLAVAL